MAAEKWENLGRAWWAKKWGQPENPDTEAVGTGQKGCQGRESCWEEAARHLTYPLEYPAEPKNTHMLENHPVETGRREDRRFTQYEQAHRLRHVLFQARFPGFSFCLIPEQVLKKQPRNAKDTDHKSPKENPILSAKRSRKGQASKTK